MFTQVFSFAQKPNASSTKRGTVRHIDITIYEMCICDESDTTLCIALDPHDCTEALYGIVRHGEDAVRIDCEYDATQRCVKLYLMVDQDVVDRRLSQGSLPAEEHVIFLARQVWREALIPHETGNDGNETPSVLQTLEMWNPKYPLFPHQERSVSWILDMESRMPLTLTYSGNLKVTDTWYVDTEGESFTTDPSIREAHLTGGICADGTGAGKTATVLNVVGRTARLPYASRLLYGTNATLVIIPLNLISQWQHELKKFIPDGDALTVHFLLGKEIRNMTMEQLRRADLVITTFHFLRASKAYSELVDSALGGKPRTRAVLSSWARCPGRVEPILEAVRWRRIVVDELHETFESPRDLRHLKLLTWDCLWGLTATPILDSEQAQYLYLLLAREKAHHPNILAQIIDYGVECHSTTTNGSVPNPVIYLKLVQLSAEERIKLQLAETLDVADIVRRCTLGTRENSSVVRVETLRAKVEGHQRSVRIMEGLSVELENELERLVSLSDRGDPDAAWKVEYARRACLMHEKDLATARSCLDTDQGRLTRLEASDTTIQERLSFLSKANKECTLCGERKCDSLVNCCSSMYCRTCLDERNECPACSCPLTHGDIVSVPTMNGLHSKMTQIGQLIVSLHEPVVLFVQWKSMIRFTRSFLSSIGIRVLLLDGNTAQRTATLAEFLSTGVLLLCLEESFAGLHLPHVRQIVFAHAIVAERKQVEHLEEQAIARCVRHGQTEQVNVYSFVITESEEEHLWRRTH